ncbi:MAG: hypothetical protein BA863_10395 [Desulfovibrio sp. S3730MH75]|nr:MAG: hypothetical protein BA863_10395 [Desulfovibrio sp. S3730MH75]
MEIADAKCTAETEKAILVEAPDFGEPTWVPQSQIDDSSEVYEKGHEGTLIVSDWWAEKQGWK